MLCILTEKDWNNTSHNVYEITVLKCIHKVLCFCGATYYIFNHSDYGTESTNSIYYGIESLRTWLKGTFH